MSSIKITISSDITEWTENLKKFVYNSLVDNPFFSNWKKMTIGIGSLKEEKFDSKKALALFMSDKKIVSFNIYSEDTSSNANEICITRTKNYYKIWLQIEQEYFTEMEAIMGFKNYMINLALKTPKFKRLRSLTSISFDIKNKYNIEDERSIFLLNSWIDVLSPLSYEGYFEKEDLLKAPFYEVKEIAPDIVMIQAYKDPFDIENEESLNYLRNGVEYLNKNIIYLKGK